MYNYGNDLIFFDYNYDYPDPIFRPYLPHPILATNITTEIRGDASNHSDRTTSKHRHDGKSPLPLGMDWSPPPRNWEGRDTLWPHESHTGWSYCVTIPSWVFLPNSKGSHTVVFYKVQVGIQSPEGVTTTRSILRRFNDFMDLYSELKTEYAMKKLPYTPPKKILRARSQTSLEERRFSLEDWMQKLLSDIDLSRSVAVAIFLELEAAARSSFDDVNQNVTEEASSSLGAVSSSPFQSNSDVSVNVSDFSAASKPVESASFGTPKFEAVQCRDVNGASLGISEKDFKAIDKKGLDISENISNVKALRLDGTEFSSEVGLDVQKLSIDRNASYSSSNEVVDSTVVGGGCLHSTGDSNDEMEYCLESSDAQLSGDLILALPQDERKKLNRVILTLQQRLATMRTDIEDLMSRLDQEVAVKNFLTTKVKDMETELETTRSICKENMQHTVLTEKERFTQMQWDMEELGRKNLEMEIRLKSEQDKRMQSESTKTSVMEENRLLLQKLDVTRDQLDNLQKNHNEFEEKSKADVKLLLEEVNTLRSSNSELKQEFDQLATEKLEAERNLQDEKRRVETFYHTNAELVQECQILFDKLQECTLNLHMEEEDKPTVDHHLSSDALDLLATSDSRITLLLAEARLLAQNIENAGAAALSQTQISSEAQAETTDSEMRRMVSDIFIDNATLRKKINSVIRCALHNAIKTDDFVTERKISVNKEF